MSSEMRFEILKGIGAKFQDCLFSRNRLLEFKAYSRSWQVSIDSPIERRIKKVITRLEELREHFIYSNPVNLQNSPYYFSCIQFEQARAYNYLLYNVRTKRIEKKTSSQKGFYCRFSIDMLNFFYHCLEEEVGLVLPEGVSVENQYVDFFSGLSKPNFNYKEKTELIELFNKTYKKRPKELKLLQKLGLAIGDLFQEFKYGEETKELFTFELIKQGFSGYFPPEADTSNIWKLLNSLQNLNETSLVDN